MCNSLSQLLLASSLGQCNLTRLVKYQFCLYPHTLIPSHYHTVTLSYSHTLTLSYPHTITPSHYHTVTVLYHDERTKAEWNDDDVEIGRCLSRKTDIQCSSSMEVSECVFVTA